MSEEADLPRVTQILKGAGLIDTTWFTDYGRDRGTALHLATEYLDRGDLDKDSLDPAIAPMVDSYRLFLKEVQPEILSVEEEVENPLSHYRGRLDRRVRVGRWTGILDIKSGGPADWHAIQLAAYAGCFPGPMHRWGLYLSDTGYRLIEYKDRGDWPVFVAALTLFHWRKNHA